MIAEWVLVLNIHSSASAGIDHIEMNSKDACIHALTSSYDACLNTKTGEIIQGKDK